MELSLCSGVCIEFEEMLLLCADPHSYTEADTTATAGVRKAELCMLSYMQFICFDFVQMSKL